MKKPLSSKIGGAFKNWNTFLVVLLVLEFVVFGLANEKFLRIPLLLNSINDFIAICLISLFVTFVMITGGIDIQAGSIVGLTSIVIGVFWQDFGLNIWGAVLLAVAIAAVCGALSGFFVAYCGVQAMVVTLGGQFLYAGLALLVSTLSSTESYQGISGFPESFKALTGFKLFGVIPSQVLIFLGMTVIAWLLLHKSKYGRKVFLVGVNPQAAEYSGINTRRVIRAFQEYRVAGRHFAPTTGYGYDDQGREVLDKVVATAFGTEDALVRHNFVSGTHALTVALFGILRTGDTMVSLTGRPYDTLEGVIGLNDDTQSGSLKNFGVTYREVPLLKDGTPDYEAVPDAVRGAKVAYIQRSRGYSLRPALTVAQIQRLAELVRSTNPDAVIMVDNCYGEFVETSEPVEVGCDLMIGSMIKNVGGGIARTGGYIAGKEALVQQCAERLTCIGMGKEVGCSLDMNRELYLGFFHAPDTTANALKTADFAAALFGSFGFSCHPPVGTTRGDIVEAICLGDEAHLTAFCQGIQQGSPVDSFVVPEAWDMPGYTSKVIMAAGAFTMGASIELSADAPIREPFAVWMQGGMTYTSGKIGVLLAAQKMLDQGLISL